MDMSYAEVMNILAKGIQPDMNSIYTGPGYITEKLYMLLQLYLQNKGWNPSVELLQCFAELKESSALPSAAYLQVLASRVTLDTQGRLVLRENGKIVLPFEHFANAVMLKHMNGPHGLHLSLEATVRAVVDSYTIGRDSFGMEKEFILDVVQNCPSPTCRFYKPRIDLSQSHSKQLFIPESQQQPPAVPTSSSISLPTISTNAASVDNGPTSMAPPVLPLARCSTPLPNSRPSSVDSFPSFESTMNNRNARSTSESPTPSNSCIPIPPPSPKPISKPLTPRQQQQNKLADFLKANIENFDQITGPIKETAEMLWAEEKKCQDANQDKIIRAFSEIMKNMARMKSCVRPAMCKPYGKQSEALQKTVIDTIQLVQSLRSFLPPPHIAVSSWKNDDKLGRVKPANLTIPVSGTTATSNSTSNMAANVDECNISRPAKISSQE